MKVGYITDQNIADQAKALLVKASFNPLKLPIDVSWLATRHLNLKIGFENLKGIYGENTLGCLLYKEKVILCDDSLIPQGERKEIKERTLNFTIAHEIAHYSLHGGYMQKEDSFFFHENFNKNEKGRLEIQANKFAACLLMPEQSFKAEYKILYDQYLVAPEIQIRLQGSFHVSLQAISNRIKNLKLS